MVAAGEISGPVHEVAGGVRRVGRPVQTVHDVAQRNFADENVEGLLSGHLRVVSGEHEVICEVDALTKRASMVHRRVGRLDLEALFQDREQVSLGSAME